MEQPREAGESRAWAPGPAAYAALAVLALGNFNAFLDRQIISLLIEPIRVDLNLNDTQASLLMGLAFGLFYTLLAIPIGRLVDVWVRNRVAAIGMAVWSIATVACGFAQTFTALFIARVGVGAGEASLNPAAYSMLADAFPRDRLSTVIGVYTMAAFLGAAAALIGGGLILQHLSAIGPITIEGLGVFKPWQMTFILVGLPGVLIAALALLIQEPIRRGEGASEPVAFRDVVAAMSHGPRGAAFGFLIAAFAVQTFSSYASSSWNVPFFMRTFGWEPAQAGLYYGLAFLVFGAGGAFAGGWYGDRLRAQGKLDAQIRAAMIGTALAWPLSTASTLVPNEAAALALIAGGMFFTTFVYPLAASAIQVITPNRMRGAASAMYLTAINLVGLGLGPLAVGLMNDYGFGRPEAIGYSLATVNAVTSPLMVLLLAAALAPFRRAVQAGA